MKSANLECKKKIKKCKPEKKYLICNFDVAGKNMDS